MPVERIKRLRDCGVFRDFTWPSDLPEFGRFNLIYGWNGSGKTTLSRLLRCLETKVASLDGESTITVAGSDISRDTFSQATIPIRVFNREFVSESVFPTAGEVAPILVLGKENVDKQKQVGRMKAELATAQDNLRLCRAAKSTADTQLDNFCIENARLIKEVLRSSGTNRYNNYNKADFRSRAQELLSATKGALHVLEDADRDTLRGQLQTPPRSKIEKVDCTLPNLPELATTVQSLLAETVVSKAIQALKDDPERSSWVHAGLALHQHRKTGDCLFCEQPLPRDRLSALEAHFSTAFEDLIQRLRRCSTTVRTSLDAIAAVAIPHAVQFYDEFATDLTTADGAMRVELEKAAAHLQSLIDALATKEAHAFENLPFKADAPSLDLQAIDGVNGVIGKHNLACDDFQSRLDGAREQLERDSVAGGLAEFQRLSEAVQTAINELTLVEEAVESLSNNIASLEREIVEHRKPAEQLNEDLHKYLGHNELSLEIRETGYGIMRYDKPAQSLSEGETTAIALLYFLKTLQDHRFDLATGVVVLDDPVSSLDANALYSAFGFIRSRTQDAAQLFILTHSFALFRQVRNWFHHLKGQNKKDILQRPARFFMLACSYQDGQRRTNIQALDPLLERFESEYHYLFAYVYRTAASGQSAQLEQNYMLPNLARRLLETFLAFRQPHVSGELWHKLQQLDFDEAKKLRIIRFLHTHSHGDVVGEPEHDLSLLSESQAILSDLLGLMKSQDGDHFTAMESLLATAASEDQ